MFGARIVDKPSYSQFSVKISVQRVKRPPSLIYGVLLLREGRERGTGRERREGERGGGRGKGGEGRGRWKGKGGGMKGKGGKGKRKGRGRGQGVTGPPFRKFLDPPLQ